MLAYVYTLAGKLNVLIYPSFLHPEIGNTESNRGNFSDGHAEVRGLISFGTKKVSYKSLNSFFSLQDSLNAEIYKCQDIYNIVSNKLFSISAVDNNKK